MAVSSRLPRGKRVAGGTAARAIRAARPAVYPRHTGWPRRTGGPSYAVPVALICFVLVVATTLIYGIIARTPDTHSNLWNEVRDGYTRTEVSWVESEPGPLMASLPLVASSSVSSLPAGGAPGAAPASAPALPAAVAPQDPSFSKDVLPIFKANCFACHSGAVALGGVSLVSYQSLTDTKAHKQLLVPGKPQDSLLMNLLRKTAGVQMPPLSPLEPDKIQTIENWIKQGGKDN